MKKMLSATIFATALLMLAYTAKSQTYYTYTYYDHHRHLPVHVSKVVRPYYGDYQMVSARSFYVDGHIAYNMVFNRGNAYVEVLVDHHGHITKRVNYTYNPVVHVWHVPAHQHHNHYYVKEHHHSHKYKKESYGHSKNKHYANHHKAGNKHHAGHYEYKKWEESRSSKANRSRERNAHNKGSQTDRHHSYARR